MKQVFVFLLSASLLMGDTGLSIISPSGNIKAGSSFSISISIAGTSGTNDEGVQFSISGIPWPFTSNVGAQALSANKNVQCAMVNGVINCLAWGGTGPLIDGQIASLTITVPTTVKAGVVTGVTSNTLAATTDAAGNVTGAPVVAPGPFPLNITSATAPCDLNGDGVVDGNDRALIVSQTLGMSACVNDLNKDGKCNSIDVQIIENVIGGRACTAQ